MTYKHLFHLPTALDSAGHFGSGPPVGDVDVSGRNLVANCCLCFLATILGRVDCSTRCQACMIKAILCLLGGGGTAIQVFLVDPVIFMRSSHHSPGVTGEKKAAQKKPLTR